MDSCLDRIEEVMAQAELPDEGVRHLPPRAPEGVPEVEFRDVGFAYGDGREVIRGLSFAQAPNMIKFILPDGFLFFYFFYHICIIA